MKTPNSAHTRVTPINLSILLEQNEIDAGDCVRGKVSMNAPHRGGKLHLIIRGQEETEILQSDANDHSARIHHVTDKTSSTLYYFDLPLATLEEGIQDYAFEQPLPANLPSCMAYHDGNVASCRIHYHVEAYVDKDRDESVSLPFYVIGRHSSSPKESAKDHEINLSKIDVKSLLGRTCGFILLGSDIQEHQVVKPQSSRLCLSLLCANESSAPIKELNVSLIEHVDCWTLKGSGHRHSSECVLDATTVPCPPVWKPHSTTDLEQLLRDACHLHLNVPSNTNPTYDSSKLIQVRHEVVVKARTKGCWISSPECHMPIRVEL
jgi:hypothetical protein